jgi:putative DNA primase/helicase
MTLLRENSPPILSAALALAARGFAIFPVAPRTKAPLCEHGHLDATTDRKTITTWWRRWPGAAIGNRPAEDEAVFDVDVRSDGDKQFDELVRRLGPLPPTVTTITGGGGRHLRFRLRERVDLPRQLAHGIDLKSAAGYVILPPSRHPSGRRYEWAPFCNPGEQIVAELPAAWFEEIRRRGAATKGPALLPDLIPERERNDTLFRFACLNRRAGASPGGILALLREENATRCKPPLEDAELRRIAQSAGRYAPAPAPTAPPSPAGGR